MHPTLEYQRIPRLVPCPPSLPPPSPMAHPNLPLYILPAPSITAFTIAIPFNAHVHCKSLGGPIETCYKLTFAHVSQRR